MIDTPKEVGNRGIGISQIVNVLSPKDRRFIYVETHQHCNLSIWINDLMCCRPAVIKSGILGQIRTDLLPIADSRRRSIPDRDTITARTFETRYSAFGHAASAIPQAQADTAKTTGRVSPRFGVQPELSAIAMRDQGWMAAVLGIAIWNARSAVAPMNECTAERQTSPCRSLGIKPIARSENRHDVLCWYISRNPFVAKSIGNE